LPVMLRVTCSPRTETSPFSSGGEGRQDTKSGVAVTETGFSPPQAAGL
jgi:hypothetical protein